MGTSPINMVSENVNESPALVTEYDPALIVAGFVIDACEASKPPSVAAEILFPETE